MDERFPRTGWPLCPLMINQIARRAEPVSGPGARSLRCGHGRALGPAGRWRAAAVACSGGRGRTGTALACLAILDGLPRQEAVAFVREHYHPRAVETFRQRRYIARFTPP
jgi:hypothetical protein